MDTAKISKIVAAFGSSAARMLERRWLVETSQDIARASLTMRKEIIRICFTAHRNFDPVFQANQYIRRPLPC